MRLRLLALLVVGLVSCSGPAQTQLEVWTNGAYQAVAVAGYEITGKRQGGTTRATAVVTLQSGERLQLELEVTYDPKPVLSAGSWNFSGTPPAAGAVHSESLKFLGGQGEGPSLGGRFRLEQDGKPRYRAVLPLRLVEQTTWSTQ